MYPNLPQLQTIYASFETEAAVFKAEAACRRGCAFCCTDAGGIHILTLEGLAIGEALGRLTKPQQTIVRKSMAKDRQRREKGLSSPCPFLMKNKACMIYAARPFACRRIYSVQTCSPSQPPTLSRRVMALGDHAINRLQQLDHIGYSGHMTYILYMLETPRFRSTYLTGDFKPEEIMDFGKSHGIIINRMVSNPPEL
jgi:hypothetical protein